MMRSCLASFFLVAALLLSAATARAANAYDTYVASIGTVVNYWPMAVSALDTVGANTGIVQGGGTCTYGNVIAANVTGFGCSGGTGTWIQPGAQFFIASGTQDFSWVSWVRYSGSQQANWVNSTTGSTTKFLLTVDTPCPTEVPGSSVYFSSITNFTCGPAVVNTGVGIMLVTSCFSQATCTLYVNNVAVSPTYSAGTFLGSGPATYDFGRSGGAPPPTGFQGGMVNIQGHALTQGEVTCLYEAGTGAPTPGCGLGGGATPTILNWN